MSLGGEWPRPAAWLQYFYFHAINQICFPLSLILGSYAFLAAVPTILIIRTALAGVVVILVPSRARRTGGRRTVTRTLTRGLRTKREREC